MAEARGLSRSVFQAPDIIGERRQQEALAEQQALQRAKFAAQQQKQFKFDDKDKLNQLPSEFSTLDLKMSEAVRNFIFENAEELNNGNPEYTGKLARFVDKYLAVKKAADLSTEQFRDDVEGLSEEQRNEFGFAGYLLDAEDLGQNMVVGDDLSISYQTPEGTKDIEDATVLFDPRSYYYKPLSWLDLATKNAVATKNSIESDGRIVTQKDAKAIRGQISNTIEHNLKENPDALASMINDYSKNVLGTQLSPDAMSRVISGQGITASTVDGEKVITLNEVTNWAKDQASNQVGLKVGLTTREEGGRDEDDPLSKLRPLTTESIPLLKGDLDVVLKSGFVVPSGTKLYAKASGEDGGDEQQVLFDIQSIYKKADGKTYAYGVGQREGEDEVRSGREIPLNEEQIKRLEIELDFPPNITIPSILSGNKFKTDEVEESIETEDTVEEKSYIYKGETYTLSEIQKQYGEDFNPLDYEGFELKK